MDYLMLMYLPHWEAGDLHMTDDEVLSCAIPVVERTTASGHYIAAGILRSVETATSVRVRDGQRIVTDGPFAETREQLAGYLLIKADNLDEALAIAAEHPAAFNGTVEIRPVLVLPSATPKEVQSA